jgi:hypothetical protein
MAHINIISYKTSGDFPLAHALFVLNGSTICHWQNLHQRCRAPSMPNCLNGAQ